jgi:hypothetical protein
MVDRLAPAPRSTRGGAQPVPGILHESPSSDFAAVPQLLYSEINALEWHFCQENAT